MKILREVYLRRESHLPAHGWLHACWTCESITGKTLEKPENQQKFSNSCDKFIEEYLDTCGP